MASGVSLVCGCMYTCFCACLAVFPRIHASLWLSALRASRNSSHYQAASLLLPPHLPPNTTSWWWSGSYTATCP